MNAVRRTLAFCLLTISVGSAAEINIDLTKADKLVVWKSVETGEIGPAAMTRKNVIYSAIDGDRFRQFLKVHRGQKGMPRLADEDELLLKTNLRCRDATTGKLLWNATMEFSGSRTRYPIGLTPLSAPSISLGRVFEQSADGQVVALALGGFADGKNKGPFRWEQNRNSDGADILWYRDLQTDLKIVPGNIGDVGAPIAQPLPVGDVIYCTTGNCGVFAEMPNRHPNLNAPSFVAISASDGTILWQNNDPSGHCNLYQNASPFLVSDDAQPKAIGFPGGDGFLYIVDAGNGSTLTRLRCFSDDPPQPQEKAARGEPKFFSVTPTVALPYILACQSGTVDTATETVGRQRCPVFAYKMKGDRAADLAWTFDDQEFLGTLAPILVHGNEVFVLGVPDRLIVLDLKTGTKLRESKLPGGCNGHSGMTIWGKRLIIYLNDGIHIVANDATLTPVASLEPNEMLSTLSQPTIVDNRLMITTASTLWILDLETLNNLLK